MATLSKQMAVAIAPKFTAASSAFGSLLIVLLIHRERRRQTIMDNRNKVFPTYFRLVFGMSVCDISASVAWFFTTWPIPQGTPGVYAAVGNQNTCSAQAFFAQFSLSTVMYNASLAIYFVLVVVKNWSAHDIAKVEPFFHINAIAWGVATAFSGLALGLFNPVGWDCWIAPSPLGCKERWTLQTGEVSDCVRGDNASLYQWAFYYAPLWIVILLVSALMYWVYVSVRNQEARMVRRFSAEVNNVMSSKVMLHKKFQTQAAHYVGAFLISWFFPTIFQLVIVIGGVYPWPLLFLTAVSVPIQGVLNLITFTRPKFIKYRKTHHGYVVLDWVRMLQSELGLVCEGKKEQRDDSTPQPQQTGPLDLDYE
ncbi:hypothetical protein ACHAW6_003797 [Cyclotella cf. meneghiniana]